MSHRLVRHGLAYRGPDDPVYYQGGEASLVELVELVYPAGLAHELHLLGQVDLVVPGLLEMLVYLSLMDQVAKSAVVAQLSMPPR